MEVNFINKRKLVVFISSLVALTVILYFIFYKNIPVSEPVNNPDDNQEVLSSSEKPDPTISAHIGNNIQDDIENGNKSDDVIVISVSRPDIEYEAKSLTGGETWLGDEVPAFYMTMDTTTYPKDIGNLTVMIFNNGYKAIVTGSEYRLFMWNGSTWGPSPTDIIEHHQIAYTIEPNKTLSLDCSFYNIELESGLYLLEKKIWLEDDISSKYALSIEVNIH